jgi:hypothetical protein
MEEIVDYSPPSSSDVEGWLSDALSALAGIPYTNSSSMLPEKTMPLGNNAAALYPPLAGERNKLYFMAEANEDVVMKVRGAEGSNVTFSFNYDTGVKLDTYLFEGLGSDVWDAVTFVPPVTGRYYVTWNYNYSPIWIDLEGHTGAAYESSLNSPTLFSLHIQVLLCPAGSCILHYRSRPPAVNGDKLSATLTDPNNVITSIESSYDSSSPYKFTLPSPHSGLWKIDLDLSTTIANREGQFWFEESLL